MADLFSLTYIPALNRNNVGIPGAQLAFYEAGTGTPAPIYTDDALTVEHTNPVIAGADAKFPNIYLDPDVTYRVRLLDVDGAPLPYEVDPYRLPITVSQLGLLTALQATPPIIPADVSHIETLGYSVAHVGRGRYVEDAAFDLVTYPRAGFTAADGRKFRLSTQQTVTDFMFGAINGTDVADAFEAWSNFISVNRCNSAASLAIGTSARAINFNTTGTICTTYDIFFGFSLVATAAMETLLTLNDMALSKATFGCNVYGHTTTGSAVAVGSRFANHGIRLLNAGRAAMTGTVFARNFVGFGFIANGGAASFSELPYVRALDCGSSPRSGATNRISANWSSPVQNGSSGSLAQTTTIEVDAIPPASLTAWGFETCVKIAGYPYRVSAISGTGPWTLTLSIPWLDNASVAAGSGTLEYIFGGCIGILGSDNSSLRVRGDGLRCGYALLDMSLFGATVTHLGAHDCEVWLGCGTGHNGSQNGGNILGGYTEITVTYHVISFSDTTRFREIAPIGGTGFDFTKTVKHGPRQTSGTLNNQRLRGFTSIAGSGTYKVVAGQGAVFSTTYDPPSIAAGASASTTLTVPDCAVTDAVEVTFSNSLSGLLVFGSVTTASAGSAVITVTFTNPSGGAAANPTNLASGTLFVRIR